MPNASQYFVRDFLASIQKEGMKLFRVYDGTGRVTIQYEAVSSAKDGDLCMRTIYNYDGSSFRVTKMLETITTWQAIWEVAT